MTWINARKSAAAMLAVFVAGVASAASPQTTSFNVSLTIVKNCTVNTITDMTFANQTFLTANVDATTSLTVNCTKGTSATVALSGTSGSRTMTNGTNTIAYDLYSDSAHTTAWDSTNTVSITGAGVDSAGATLDASTATGTTRTIYGRVPPQQTNSTGVYTDSVTATVTF